MCFLLSLHHTICCPSCSLPVFQSLYPTGVVSIHYGHTVPFWLRPDSFQHLVQLVVFSRFHCSDGQYVPTIFRRSYTAHTTTIITLASDTSATTLMDSNPTLPLLMNCRRSRGWLRRFRGIIPPVPSNLNRALPASGLKVLWARSVCEKLAIAAQEQWNTH